MPWIRRVRTSPPLDADVGIDWDNPLNKDIGFLSYDVGQGHRNLVTGAQAITQGDVAQGVNVVGPGGLFSSSGVSQIHPAVQTTSALITYACLYVKTGTAENYGRIFGRTAQNGGAIPYTNWDFELNPNSEGQTKVVATIAAGANTFYVTGSTGSRPTVADDGEPHFLLAENTDGGKLSLWVDGVKAALQSTTGAGVAYNNTTNDKIIFSGSSDAANANRVATFVPIGMFWNRGLSAEEIASVYANPYQLLEPELVWVPAAAGGGISATASITLADVTSSATGTLPITAALAKTLDAVTTSATGTLPISGAAAITLGDLTSSATGTSANTATLSKTLDDVTTSATGTLPIVAASSVTLDALTTSATGTLPLAAASSVTLDDVTTVATGTQGGNSGTASITLDALTTTATGTLPIAAAAGITLDAATVASAATLALKGAQSTTLEDVTLTAAGVVGSFVYGQADITLGDVTLTSAGTLPIAGSASVSLDALSLSAASTLLIKGSASITLANLTIYATSGDIVDRLFTSDIAVLTVPIIYFPITQPVNYVATDINTDLFVVQ